jgi:pimeloyl-ACP methyl ester carboxylesterase
MVDSLDEVSRLDFWDDGARIRSTTLIVRAESGLSRGAARRMQEAVPGARVARVNDSAHYVHLEQPRAWRTTLQRFLTELA